MGFDASGQGGSPQAAVNNVGTAAMVDLVETGQPLIDRVATVSGDGVRRPANLLVPLDTSIRAMLDYCGGIRPETRQVLLGGPMMGMAQKNLDAPRPPPAPSSTHPSHIPLVQLIRMGARRWFARRRPPFPPAKGLVDELLRRREPVDGFHGIRGSFHGSGGSG